MGTGEGFGKPYTEGNIMRKLQGSKEKVILLGRELMRVGLPSGIRQLDRSLWEIEIDEVALQALEKVHISVYMARAVGDSTWWELKGGKRK